MTLDDLRLYCNEIIKQPGYLGIRLTIPKGKILKGFQRSVLLNEYTRNGETERTYRFSPLKISKWLEKQECLHQK